MEEFSIDELNCLSGDEFKLLRAKMEKEIRELETEQARVTILLTLLDTKDELVNEIAEGHTRIRSYKEYMDYSDDVIISSRNDNIITECDVSNELPADDDAGGEV